MQSNPHQPELIFHHDGMYARKRPLPLCVYSVECTKYARIRIGMHTAQQRAKTEREVYSRFKIKIRRGGGVNSLDNSNHFRVRYCAGGKDNHGIFRHKIDIH